LDAERTSIDKRRELVKSIANDITGEKRRRNIETLMNGTGGGDVPTFIGNKPQTASYGTARGSKFNQKFQGIMQAKVDNESIGVSFNTSLFDITDRNKGNRTTKNRYR